MPDGYPKATKEAADLILRYEPERIHTLVPGIMVLQFIADRYGVEDITISRYGVRGGVSAPKDPASLAPEYLIFMNLITHFSPCPRGKGLILWGLPIQSASVLKRRSEKYVRPARSPAPQKPCRTGY